MLLWEGSGGGASCDGGDQVIGKGLERWYWIKRRANYLQTIYRRIYRGVLPFQGIESMFIDVISSAVEAHPDLLGITVQTSSL